MIWTIIIITIIHIFKSWARDFHISSCCIHFIWYLFLFYILLLYTNYI
jgi:hypothetical protein